jgi:predicted SAM-dependent methyltransferase
MLQLNVGAGTHEAEGWTPVDRLFGQEAYPLDVEDESVDVIRASHVLEHFGRHEIVEVCQHWVSKLKPGGVLKIAVPDLDKMDRAQQQFEAYLFGSQSDENDFHKTVWYENKLRQLLDYCGLVDVHEWVDEIEDCSRLPVSLNLQGTKPREDQAATVAPAPDKIRIRACMSIPRYGALTARGIMEAALKPFGIPLQTSQGVFWEHHMDRMFTKAVDDDIDWLLALDFDSVFTRNHLDQLLGTFGDGGMDALAAVQVRRQSELPLFSVADKPEVEMHPVDPLLVTTAHFGMTLFRVAKLKGLPKPWFCGVPDPTGGWGEGRKDPDIQFWNSWRKAGYNIYVDPQVRIGHLEEVITYYDHRFEAQQVSTPEWRETFLPNDDYQSNAS